MSDAEWIQLIGGDIPVTCRNCQCAKKDGKPYFAEVDQVAREAEGLQNYGGTE